MTYQNSINSKFPWLIFSASRQKKKQKKRPNLSRNRVGPRITGKCSDKRMVPIQILEAQLGSVARVIVASEALIPQIARDGIDVRWWRVHGGTVACTRSNRELRIPATEAAAKKKRGCGGVGAREGCERGERGLG